MNAAQRRALLAAAAPGAGESWGDLGCGEGAFTLPLIEAVGAGGFVLAADRDAAAIAALRASIARLAAPLPRVELRVSDIGTLDGAALPPLDGILLANVLHYLPDPRHVLGALAPALRAGGRLLVVEYDRADATPWVPYPIPVAALGPLARDAGLAPFEVGGRVRSDFGRMLYAAVARPARTTS